MANRLWLGIKRHWRRALLAFFVSLTGLWSLMEPLFSLLDIEVKRYNWLCLLAYILFSLIITAISVWPKSVTSFRFANTGTRVKILYGNLFDFTGNIVIPVNEFFDSEIGRPVSSNSVHGAFIQNVLGGHRQLMDQEVEKQLHGIPSGQVARPQGKQKRYEIGTTITVDHNRHQFFLFAMSSSDNNCKASSNPAMMLAGLDGLWNKVRIEGNGDPVYIPLVGNGLSGVGLPPSQLLSLILISILKSVKEKDLNTTIHIVLREDVFDDIDLDLIKNNWT